MRRLVCLAGCLLACGGAPTPAPEGMVLDYGFAPRPGLDAMAVRICAEGAFPDALVPIHPAGGPRLRRAWIEGGAELAAGSPLDTTSVPRGGCVVLDVELSTTTFSRSPVVRTESSLVAPTSAWLWAPRVRPPDLVARARFDLPPGVARSTVFRTEGESLVLDDAAFEFVSYVAFGDLEPLALEAGGTRADVALVDGGLGLERTERYVGGALRTASMLGGGLLPPLLSVIVVPVSEERSDATQLGLAAHGAVPSVLLFVSDTAPGELLDRDWAIVHELVHLTMPHLTGEDAWLAEGLATYYQEILRARSGVITEEEAWRALTDGFERGLESDGTTLREATRRMDETHDYLRVYWSGAAIALLADVRLHEDGRSLEDALRAIASDRAREVTATELALLLDGGTPGIVSELVTAAAESTEPPEVRAALESLGVTGRYLGLRLAPSVVRDAIVRGSTPWDPENMNPGPSGTVD